MFAPDLKFTPWWWEWAPRRERNEPELPRDAEIAIVGSGFTGLSAALTLARAGREVVVLEADAPGFGASSRNGGQVGSGNQRYTTTELKAMYGEELAGELLREGMAALEYVCGLIEEEEIDCHFRRAGRFRAARRASHWEPMLREHEALSAMIGLDFTAVPKASLRDEIDTDLYHGGVVLNEDATVHPAMYHSGLLERVEAAGVRVVPFTRVQEIVKERQRIALRTSRGEISAGHAIAATNGYTTNATPDLKARVVPIPSGIIATEELPADVIARLLPNCRVMGETGRIYHYYQVSPDGKRILWGGRAKGNPHAPRSEDFVHLYRGLIRLFPELDGVKVTHAWGGYVAYTKDVFPHAGVRDGIHYAMGYCGSGVARATHLGHRIALKILGEEEGATAWDQLEFKPYLSSGIAQAMVPAVSNFYRLLDAMER